MFIAHSEPLDFVLPEGAGDRKWRLIMDTQTAEGFVKRAKTYQPKDKVAIAARSLVLLQSRL